MVKEEVLRLIKGRIEDEHHKHPLLDWSAIAANKIYSQWFEYLNNENQDLQDKISKLEKEMENCNHPYEYLSFGEDNYCECEKCKTRLN